MSARIEIGSKWGRWTVMRRTAPAHRYGERSMRTRVLVRCVCGHEQPVFASDLQARKTGGCKSFRCRIRWEIRRELLALV